MEIDIERLRDDLMNYFGSAMSFFPVAIMDLSRVERATPEELIKIALDNKIDLTQYEVHFHK